MRPPGATLAGLGHRRRRPPAKLPDGNAVALRTHPEPSHREEDIASPAELLLEEPDMFGEGAVHYARVLIPP